MENAIGILLCFGGLFLGALLFFGARFARRNVEVVAWCLSLHVLATIGVFGFVRFNKAMGYSEWFYASYAYIPVNLVFIVVYISVAWRIWVK